MVIIIEREHHRGFFEIASPNLSQDEVDDMAILIPSIDCYGFNFLLWSYNAQRYKLL